MDMAKTSFISGLRKALGFAETPIMAKRPYTTNPAAKKYIDVPTPSQAFNVSGNLPGTPIPTKKRPGAVR